VVDKKSWIDAVGEIVKTRITSPLPKNPVVELYAVHLCANHMVIDLVGDIPPDNIDRSKTLLKPSHTAILFLHCSGCKVGDSVSNPRLYELAKLLK
jgi:hypothetical protein